MKDVSWHVFTDHQIKMKCRLNSFYENLIDVLPGINNQQPTCSILVGDFNAKFSKWCPSDKDTKTGQDIDTSTTTSGYTQMIGQPVHIMNDKSPHIDLLFTTNSTLLCDVGVEQTIYWKYHHNIIYGSLHLSIPLPPPCHREVWDYKNTDTVCIQRAISLVNWNDVFSNKTADEKVNSLNNILLNIFRSLIPNKVIKFDYKYPSWMNPKIISSLRNRSKLTKRYYCNPTEENKSLLTVKSKDCSTISEAKERYTNKLSKKLDDPSAMPTLHEKGPNTELFLVRIFLR